MQATKKKPLNNNASTKKSKALDKQGQLELAVDSIEKQFGKGTIIKLGDVKATNIEVIPTGSLALDVALGTGGLPKGRIVEIYGPESSGKTTLTLHAIAESQKSGGVCAFIDAEHALDVKYARRIGVQVDDLLVSQPDTGEQALEIVELLVKSGSVDLIVIDSVAALTPRAEIEGDMGDKHVGLQARLMSQALRKLTSITSHHNVTIIFINQLRMKIGVMFGNPETTTGGNALKFYSSVRLDIRRIASIKKTDQIIGNRVRVKVVKNKLAAPFKEAEFDIMFDEGVSSASSLLDLAVKLDLVKKNGSWFSYEDQMMGQGREGVREFFAQNPDIFKSLSNAILEHYGLLMSQRTEPTQKETTTIPKENNTQKKAGASSRPMAPKADLKRNTLAPTT
ncbi:MAG: recombinase RecA [Proteobacteria bacterium]|nr:recombinase RecA [Pseudomonadota bacterium]